MQAVERIKESERLQPQRGDKGQTTMTTIKDTANPKYNYTVITAPCSLVISRFSDGCIRIAVAIKDRNGRYVGQYDQYLETDGPIKVEKS